MRFDAYARRQPVTESSYINSLAIRPCRSTIKTLPATLPEPWTAVRGQRSKPIGPWSTDLEPRIVDSISRCKLRGFPLLDAGPGVTGDGCRIWIESGRGVGRMLGGGCYSDLGQVMGRLMQGRLILFGRVVVSKSCPDKQPLQYRLQYNKINFPEAYR